MVRLPTSHVSRLTSHVSCVNAYSSGREDGEFMRIASKQKKFRGLGKECIMDDLDDLDYLDLGAA